MRKEALVPAEPIITPASVSELIPLEGFNVSVTIIPDPVVSVVTPGTLPVFVILLIIEVARVGLLSSAAAVGGIVDKKVTCEVPCLEVSVTNLSVAEEVFKLAAGEAFGVPEIEDVLIEDETEILVDEEELPGKIAVMEDD